MPGATIGVGVRVCRFGEGEMDLAPAIRGG